MSLNSPRISLVPQLKNLRTVPKKQPDDKPIQMLTIKSYKLLSKQTLSSVKTCEKTSLSKAFKTRSVCVLREANQSRDWLQRAKESIIKELSLFINASNCIEVNTPQSASYKYYLGKGNNSSLIKKVLKARPWWVGVEESQIHEANLVWTQVKIPDFFETCEKFLEKTKKINHELTGKNLTCEELLEDFSSSLRNLDISSLGYSLITQSTDYIGFHANFKLDPLGVKVQNKLEFNFNLSDKKNLLKNMKNFYLENGENVFNYLPLTFHIDSSGAEINEFIRTAQSLPNQLWIVKPGEDTNRGTGISITNNLNEVLSEVSPVSRKTYIVQKYIEKPFLINKRKFDIRLYTLCTSFNGVFQAYFYQEGYLRTASKNYNSSDFNKYIHLTNDAIQNKCEDYGKWENGNKLSYSDFQRYLDFKKMNVRFLEDVLPAIKKIVKDTVKATWFKLNKEKRLFCFEIFGYDFLLDQNLKPWLLEVNTNPCLELAATNLARIIPAMIENAFKIAIDPLFPEPQSANRRQSCRVSSILAENKFELIFHQDACSI